MNTKFKKILIILIIVLIIALAGLLVYYFLVKKPSENPPTEFPEGEEGTGKPQVEKPKPSTGLKVKAISKEAVLAPTITADKKGVIYYTRPNGTIWQSDFEGNGLYNISENKLDNLVKVYWSPNKDKSINVFEDSLGSITKYLYTIENKNALPLNKYMNYLAWSSDAQKIVYQYQNDFTNDNTISISNPDGSNFSIILKTRIKNLIFDWPKGTEIFFMEKPSGMVPSSLFLLNPIKKTFEKIVFDINGFSAKWSIDGSKMLYSKTAAGGKGIGLYVAKRNGSSPLTARAATMVEKCAWSQDIRYIYCAVPQNLSDAKVLPDDFYKGTFASDDEFYKINLETGEKTDLLAGLEKAEQYDADEVFLSPDESYLFFINKFNGLLYSLKLN